jgi:hypothetical protein
MKGIEFFSGDNTWLDYPVAMWDNIDQTWYQQDQTDDISNITYMAFDGGPIRTGDVVEWVGKVSSLGSTSFQFNQNNISHTEGQCFVQDRLGLHPFSNTIDTLSVSIGFNPIGLVCFTPLGVWHKSINNQDGSNSASPNSNSDFEGIDILVNLDGSSINPDSSFDYTVNSFIWEVFYQDTSITSEAPLAFPVIVLQFILVVVIRRKRM